MTLEDLIEQFAQIPLGRLMLLQKEEHLWAAHINTIHGFWDEEAATPAEALARLWESINQTTQ